MNLLLNLVMTMTLNSSSHFDIESKLTTYYVGDTTYYVHTQTNEIYDNPKTLNVIGIMLSDKKFDLF